MRRLQKLPIGVSFVHHCLSEYLNSNLNFLIVSNKSPGSDFEIMENEINCGSLKPPGNFEWLLFFIAEK